MTLYEIMLKVLNEIEKKDTNLTIAGGKGYGTGKVYPNKTVSVLKMLGKEHNEKPKEYKIKPVKVSKAFKKEIK